MNIIYYSDHLNNGEKALYLDEFFFSVVFLFVFHAKLAITNNHRRDLSDMSYYTPYSSYLNEKKN